MGKLKPKRIIDGDLHVNGNVYARDHIANGGSYKLEKIDYEYHDMYEGMPTTPHRAEPPNDLEYRVTKLEIAVESLLKKLAEKEDPLKDL